MGSEMCIRDSICRRSPTHGRVSIVIVPLPLDADVDDDGGPTRARVIVTVVSSPVASPRRVHSPVSPRRVAM